VLRSLRLSAVLVGEIGRFDFDLPQHLATGPVETDQKIGSEVTKTNCQ
jgi:hypothetical protein